MLGAGLNVAAARLCRFMAKPLYVNVIENLWQHVLKKDPMWFDRQARNPLPSRGGRGHLRACAPPGRRTHNPSAPLHSAPARAALSRAQHTPWQHPRSSAHPPPPVRVREKPSAPKLPRPYCSHPWYLPRRLMWTGARLRKRHSQGPKTTLAHASSSSSSKCFGVARKKDGLAFHATSRLIKPGLKVLK